MSRKQQKIKNDRISLRNIFLRQLYYLHLLLFYGSSTNNAATDYTNPPVDETHTNTADASGELMAIALKYAAIAEKEYYSTDLMLFRPAKQKRSGPDSIADAEQHYHLRNK